MNQGFAMSRRGRPRLIGNRFPGGQLHDRPATAVGGWKRQLQLVDALVLDKVWGSQIAKMRRFGYITDTEFQRATEWAELVGRTDLIEGLPPRSVRSPSYETGYGRSGSSMPPTEEDIATLQRMRKARKAIVDGSSLRCLAILNDTALVDQPHGTADRLRDMKAALGALDRHWKKGRG